MGGEWREYYPGWGGTIAEGVGLLYRRYIHDAIAVVNATIAACGSGGEAEEALRLLYALRDALEEGDRLASLELAERAIDAIEELRDAYSLRGCLDAYRLEEAKAAIENIIVGLR